MNKQANLVDWADLIKNYRASGQSMSSWCQVLNNTEEPSPSVTFLTFLMGL
jgi:hypothetical protein